MALNFGFTISQARSVNLDTSDPCEQDLDPFPRVAELHCVWRMYGNLYGRQSDGV